MLHVDVRGRVRFTHEGTRFEVNKYGVVRAYRRYEYHRNSERATKVSVMPLDGIGRHKLDEAIRTARYRMHQAGRI